MRQVYVSTVFSLPVDEVWAVLGDFHRMDAWAQAIHDSTPENAVDGAPTVGSVRRLTVGELRHTTRERLVAYDAGTRQMSYELTDPPLPFRMTRYRSSIHAMPITDTDETFIEWYAEYECASSDVAGVEAKLRATYTRLLRDLRAHFDLPAVTSVD